MLMHRQRLAISMKGRVHDRSRVIEKVDEDIVAIRAGLNSLASANGRNAQVLRGERPYQTGSPICESNAVHRFTPRWESAWTMSIQLKAENGAICTLALSFNVAPLPALRSNKLKNKIVLEVHFAIDSYDQPRQP
jgi:Bacterial oxidoreductases, C-terminal